MVYVVNTHTGTFVLYDVPMFFFLYLATITSWHTRNTAWTNSTRLTRKTILTINRQYTIITLMIDKRKRTNKNWLKKFTRSPLLPYWPRSPFSPIRPWLPARPPGPLRPRSPGTPGKPCGPEEKIKKSIFFC